MSTEDHHYGHLTGMMRNVHPSEVATVRQALYDSKLALESGISEEESAALLRRIIEALDITTRWTP
jgi:hypothetical protein